MPSSELVAALDGVPRGAMSGLVYRHLSAGYSALSGEGARVSGGRWNPPESFPVIYTATPVEATLAEFRRMAARQGRTEADFVNRRLVAYRVNLVGVLDLTQADNLAALGLTSAIITADDILPCQAIGEAAHYVGYEGILAPSATSIGSVVAIFPTKLGASSTIEVLDEELLVRYVARTESPG